MKLTVGLASLTLNEVLVFYSDGTLAVSFLRHAKATLLYLSTQLVFTINHYVSLKLLWKLLYLIVHTPQTHTRLERGLYMTSTYSCVEGSLGKGSLGKYLGKVTFLLC